MKANNKTDPIAHKSTKKPGAKKLSTKPKTPGPDGKTAAAEALLKVRAERIVTLLEREYPDAVCSLEYHYERPYELLMATRLSAQCTDARVNIVTKELFSRFKSLEAFAEASIEELEAIVRPCGFFHTKAKDLRDMAQMLLDTYHGVLPDSIEELTKLPGIGRKTANLIVGDIYHQPSVVCDTHCIRITNLLGLTVGKDPAKVEQQLRQILPLERAGDFCHRLVWHGRAICVANRPNCPECVLKNDCDHALSH